MAPLPVAAVGVVAGVVELVVVAVVALAAVAVVALVAVEVDHNRVVGEAVHREVVGHMQVAVRMQVAVHMEVVGRRQVVGRREAAVHSQPEEVARNQDAPVVVDHMGHRNLVQARRMEQGLHMAEGGLRMVEEEGLRMAVEEEPRRMAQGSLELGKQQSQEGIHRVADRDKQRFQVGRRQELEGTQHFQDRMQLVEGLHRQGIRKGRTF